MQNPIEIYSLELSKLEHYLRFTRWASLTPNRFLWHNFLFIWLQDTWLQPIDSHVSFILHPYLHRKNTSSAPKIHWRLPQWTVTASPLSYHFVVRTHREQRYKKYEGKSHNNWPALHETNIIVFFLAASGRWPVIAVCNMHAVTTWFVHDTREKGEREKAIADNKRRKVYRWTTKQQKMRWNKSKSYKNDLRNRSTQRVRANWYMWCPSYMCNALVEGSHNISSSVGYWYAVVRSLVRDLIFLWLVLEFCSIRRFICSCFITVISIRFNFFRIESDVVSSFGWDLRRASGKKQCEERKKTERDKSFVCCL